MIDKIRRAVIFLSFFYMAFYLPLALIIYTPYWHLCFSRFNPRIAVIGPQTAEQGVRELSAYLRHQKPMTHPRWTLKERRHLKEVRAIMDLLLWFGAAALLMLFPPGNRKHCGRYAKINIIIAISAICILPFFKFFWRHLFHPAMFDNNLWMNTPKDFSFWIMPRIYFQYTTALLIAGSVFLNTAVLSICRFRDVKLSGGGRL